MRKPSRREPRSQLGPCLINSAALGRGLATELLQSLTAYVVVDASWVSRVEVVIDPTNAASQRVAIKAGFRPNGRRQGVTKGTGARFDDLVFVNAHLGRDEQESGT